MVLTRRCKQNAGRLKMARISKRIVDAARAGTKPAFRWEHPARLRVAGAAKRRKEFRFSVPHRRGPTRRATIAKVGTLTPEQARALAEGMSRKVKGGGDPLEDKRAAREALTVGATARCYLAPAGSPRKHHRRSYRTGRIERHLRPLLGGRHVGKLQSEDIRRAFAAIRDGKTATRIKTPAWPGACRWRRRHGTQSHRLLRAIFAWGVAERSDRAQPANGVASAATASARRF